MPINPSFRCDAGYIKKFLIRYINKHIGIYEENKFQSTANIKEFRNCQ